MKKLLLIIFAVLAIFFFPNIYFYSNYNKKCHKYPEMIKDGATYNSCFGFSVNLDTKTKTEQVRNKSIEYKEGNKICFGMVMRLTYRSELSDMIKTSLRNKFTNQEFKY
jgi:hypothetical protein